MRRLRHVGKASCQPCADLAFAHTTQQPAQLAVRPYPAPCLGPYLTRSTACRRYIVSLQPKFCLLAAQTIAVFRTTHADCLMTPSICTSRRSTTHRVANSDQCPRVAGHAYYFLEDVYPRMTGRRPLKTPGFVKAMFPGEDVISPAAFAVPAQAAVRPPGAAPAAAAAAQAAGDAGEAAGEPPAACDWLAVLADLCRVGFLCMGRCSVCCWTPQGQVAYLAHASW